MAVNSGIKTFKVGKSVYSVEVLSPMEAIDFGFRVAAIAAPLMTFGATTEALHVKNGEGTVALTQELVKALGAMNPKDVAELAREGLSHCFTPNNEPLSNPATFNSWFQEHPDELYVAGIQAVVSLVKDFFPQGLFTNVPVNS